MAVINLIGQKFGHLTVLAQDKSDGNGNARWLCECDCKDHTQKIVLGFALRNGTVQSCGCIKRLPGNGSTQDLTNKRFGKLIALEPTEERSGTGSVIWKCQCDCGNVAYAATADLNKGNKMSCGCLLSKGEEKIAYILSANAINFTRQYSPTDCINPQTNARLKFDFAIIENEQVKYLIEYDGQLHYQSVEFMKSNLEDVQYRDALKDQWCRLHSIPLIRIPYWEYDNINLEMLLRKEL